MVGPVPDLNGVYIAVSHSGISLAALIGACAAVEITDGTPPAPLLPYRPARFTEEASAKADFAPWAPGDVDWAARTPARSDP